MVRSELRYQYTWLSLQRYIEKKKKNMAQFKKQGENFKKHLLFFKFQKRWNEKKDGENQTHVFIWQTRH